MRSPHVRNRHTTAWDLVYTDWDAAEQPLREALCALGNGHIVTRGAFEEEHAGGPHYPGCYIAGGYNRLETAIADRVIENEDLVNWPNWLPLSFRVAGGDWLSLSSVDVQEFEYRLDVQRGVLERRLLFRDAGDRVFSLTSRRVVSMAQPHLAALEWRLKAHNWSGDIEIRSGLDGTVRNDNVERYADLAKQHLEVEATGYEGEDAIFLTARTSQSRARVTQAARTRVFDSDGATPVPIRRERVEHEGRIEHRMVVGCSEQRELCIEKVVAIRTSRDFAISEPETAARTDVRRAPGFDTILRTHVSEWQRLWAISDIELHNCDDDTQLILRLHIFHLLQTTSPNTIDRDVGVPARGWHGEAYRGHVFWDELFIFPFLLLRMPELTRSLLMYRYRRLDEAREIARSNGMAGACFPWQSGSSGREESQVVHLNPKSGRWVPDVSNLQRHVNAAIACNVWRYYEATCDVEFMAQHGAEVIIEIARFCESLATFDEKRGRYEICGVMGPDEFHTAYPGAEEPGLNNNAYTNVMAAWVLRAAGRVLDVLDEERRQQLRQRLGVRDDEPARWDEVSRNMYVPIHDDGIISQFDGYADLEPFDWDGYRARYGDIHRLDRILEAEDDDVNRYQASKQADVLMLFYVFSHAELAELFAHMRIEFDAGMIQRNIDYYMARTSHGSTLSRIVHYWVLARADRAEDWSLFREALHSDIDDMQGGTTPEGIHLGAMAGTVDLIQRCHTGLEIRDGVLWLDPVLPRVLADVKLRLLYRGHWLSLLVSTRSLTLSFDRGPSGSVRIGVRGEVHAMEQGTTRVFHLD
jgi:trehalose/maltose hydrolase-like predicted phosphorylase